MSKKSAQASRADRAAAAVHEQQRAERRRRNLMVGGVVLVLLAVVVGGTLWVRASDPTDDVAAPSAGDGGYGLAVGDPGAPHEVVIYEDFLCPFCGELERSSSDELGRLADDGRLFVEYRPFELLSRLGDYSRRSTNAFAVVLQASGPEVAQEFHDLLFENQPEEGGDYPDDDQLVAWAVEAGAGEDDVRPGIEGLEQADWVDEATQAALDAGVQATPTVILDGEVVSGSVEDIVDSLVEAAE